MGKHPPRFEKLVDQARAVITECTVEDVKTRLAAGENFHLVDVREESEYANARIPGAIHLGKGIIERDIEQRIPDTSDEIILYCGGGYRSALAAKNLQEMGYKNVISMDGGFRGWKDNGYELDNQKIED